MSACSRENGLDGWREEGAAKPQALKVFDGNNEFALDLYQKLAATEKGNFAISPCSIMNALGMAYLGAKGETKAELAALLRLPAEAEFGELKNLTIPKAGGVEVWPASRVWIQSGLEVKPDYLKDCKSTFDAEPALVDFQGDPAGAAKAINDWVSHQTHGMIRDLAGPSENALVLANAVYFWGPWAHPFEESETLPRETFFTLNDGDKTVALMTHHEWLAYFEDDKVQVLDLPYLGGTMSLTIVLPKKRDGLAELNRTLKWESIAHWLKSLDGQPVSLALARFETRYRVDAKAVLESLGAKSPFSPPTADFSGITTAAPLFISAVQHQTLVKVSEEGTKAAAATVAPAAPAAPPPPDAPVQVKVFRTDHPFLYMIRHRETGAILFIGQFLSP